MKLKSRHLLTWLGGIWLLLAAVILVAQLMAPVEIEVKWATETEYEIAGFNLYRSAAAEGNFIQINDHFIPSQGDAITGASYTYRDRRIVAGQRYFYRLEEVAFDNSRQIVDVGGGQAVALPAWGAAIAGISVVISCCLLVSGLRRQTDLRDL